MSSVVLPGPLAAVQRQVGEPGGAAHDPGQPGHHQHPHRLRQPHGERGAQRRHHGHHQRVLHHARARQGCGGVQVSTGLLWSDWELICSSICFVSSRSMYLCFSFCLSVCLSFYLSGSISLLVSLSVCVAVCLDYLSVCLCIYVPRSMYLSVSICPSFPCLSLRAFSRSVACLRDVVGVPHDVLNNGPVVTPPPQMTPPPQVTLPPPGGPPAASRRFTCATDLHITHLRQGQGKAADADGGGF